VSDWEMVMIYLLDGPKTDISHARFMEDIISEHTSEKVILIEIFLMSTIEETIHQLVQVLKLVTPRDIVFCPWALPANLRIDNVFTEMTERCWVVTAAGNKNESIEKWSPARTPNVITVGALNKSGVKASLSNYSEDKELEWVTGTNYSVGWKTGSGTSVAAALYTAFLAEAIRLQDYTLIEQLITKRKVAASNEVNNDKYSTDNGIP
jgi:hypothetical protein